MTLDTLAPETPDDWAVVILAAGASSRMGTPKQLLLWHNETLLRRTAQTALAWLGGAGGDNAGRVCVVLGASAPACRENLAGLPVRIVENVEWETGMASSLRAGVRAVLDAPETRGVLVMLCDTPHIGTESLSRLWAAHCAANVPVTASAYNETWGVPALFNAEALENLLGATGTDGAKKIIGRFAKENRAQLMMLPEAAEDLDTPADYARLTNG